MFQRKTFNDFKKTDFIKDRQKINKKIREIKDKQKINKR